MKALPKEISTTAISNVSDKQFADYCHSMVVELQDIASHRRLDYLAQFLSVCAIETRRIVGQSKRKAA